MSISISNWNWKEEEEEEEEVRDICNLEILHVMMDEGWGFSGGGGRRRCFGI